MESRISEAVSRHAGGYNCAQAVACAYCGVAGLDEVTMFKITEGFGLGMGNMSGTCGAATGAAVVLGLINSTGNLEAPESKARTQKLSAEFMKRFQEKNQSTLCYELKGVETKTPLRSCRGCVQDACEILEELLASIGKEK